MKEIYMAIEINETNFEKEVLSSDKPVLVDFWAPWCSPCKMLSPVIEEIASQYNGKSKVFKVNTDENMSLSAKFQITSIPCLILFKNGEVLNKIVGFRPKGDIEKLINSAL
jgi:thioredoxin 1